MTFSLRKTRQPTPPKPLTRAALTLALGLAFGITPPALGDDPQPSDGPKPGDAQLELHIDSTFRGPYGLLGVGVEYAPIRFFSVEGGLGMGVASGAALTASLTPRLNLVARGESIATTFGFGLGVIYNSRILRESEGFFGDQSRVEIEDLVRLNPELSVKFTFPSQPSQVSFRLGIGFPVGLSTGDCQTTVTGGLGFGSAFGDGIRDVTVNNTCDPDDYGRIWLGAGLGFVFF